MARMKIFNTLEENTFESPPVFNSAERKRFFSFPLMLEGSMATLRTPVNKVCFLVSAGYFKACRKFFARQFRRTDIEYVAWQIGVNPAEVAIESYSKETYARHQRAILGYFGCSPFDEPAKISTASEIAALVRVQFRPKLVLLEIIQVLTRKKIAIPSYNVLADLIVSALNRQQASLNRNTVQWSIEMASTKGLLGCGKDRCTVLFLGHLLIFTLMTRGLMRLRRRGSTSSEISCTSL